MNRVIRLAAVVMVVLAACGGGDADPTSTTTTLAAAGADSTTTSTTTTTSAPVTPGGGASGDFCGFLSDYVDETDFSVMGLSPEGMEDLFRGNLAAMQEARGRAPSEIAGDVGMFVDAYGGFIDFLDEIGFNFLSISEDALDDPRLLALEDPELTAAGDRIEEFCGIDGDFIASPPPSDGGGGGGTVSPPTATLPDDFPTDLVPPDSVVVVAIDMGGGQSVTFDVDSSTDDVIAFYSDVIGSPTVEMNEPKGALWTTEYEGTALNIVVAEVTSETVQVNIIIG